MICKIWGIKGSSGTKDISRSMDYIMDPEKTNKNANNVLDYMVNDSKTNKGEYVSGYMCNPETAIEEFILVREKDMAMKGQDTLDDDSNIAFHIVQSFAEGTNIDPELVHQCGIELCQKLGYYQAVIATHLNTDNYHNHIIINAFCMDPEKQFGEQNKYKKIKYHDCKETYALLQQYNDEIAKEHGLIIEDRESDLHYSWLEQDAKSRGESWKDALKCDILRISGDCKNWNEFVERMTDEGYTIKEGKYVTYSKNGTEFKPVRDKTLGEEYTKDYIISKWLNVESTLQDINNNDVNSIAISNKQIEKEDANGIFVRINNSEYIRIAKGKYKKLNDEYYLGMIPNRGQVPIYGKDEKLIRYYNAPALTSLFVDVNGMSKGVTLDELENKENNFQASFFYKKGWNNKKNKPYRVSLWTKDGYRKSNIELLFELALIIIRTEDNNPAKTTINSPYYASTDWKLQSMINSMKLASDNNINNLSQLDQRLNASGKAIAQINSQSRKLESSIKRMNNIAAALNGYKDLKSLYDKINSISDEAIKAEEMEKHQAEIDLYVNRTEMLKRYNIQSEHDVDDFLQRYNSMNGHLTELREKLQTCKEDYYTLKKISYSVGYATDRDFVYGKGRAERITKETNKVLSISKDLLDKEEELMVYFKVPRTADTQYVAVPASQCYKSNVNSYNVILNDLLSVQLVDYKGNKKNISVEEFKKLYDENYSTEERKIDNEISSIKNKNER